MEQYGALDVSLGAVSVCIVEADGRVAAEGVLARDPAALAGFLKLRGPRLARLGLETGPFTVGLAHALRAQGLPVEVMEARQANRVLKAMSRHKSDRRDARGLAELVRLAAYKPVALKSLEAAELRALLAARAAAEAGAAARFPAARPAAQPGPGGPQGARPGLRASRAREPGGAA